MAAFPHAIAELLLDDFSADDFEPAVRVTQMERGMPRSEVLNTEVVRTLSATAWFRSRADILAFDDWYFNTIKRVGYFELFHPKYQQTVSASFQGGKLGTLVPMTGGFHSGKRQLVFQFML